MLSEVGIKVWVGTEKKLDGGRDTSVVLLRFNLKPFHDINQLLK